MTSSPTSAGRGVVGAGRDTASSTTRTVSQGSSGPGTLGWMSGGPKDSSSLGGGSPFAMMSQHLQQQQQQLQQPSSQPISSPPSGTVLHHSQDRYNQQQQQLHPRLLQHPQLLQFLQPEQIAALVQPGVNAFNPNRPMGGCESISEGDPMEPCPPAPPAVMKVVCSSGGSFTRLTSGQWDYEGGETRLVSIPVNCRAQELYSAMEHTTGPGTTESAGLAPQVRDNLNTQQRI